MWDHIKLADIYCRLSDEEKKHGNESESITNQRAIIRDYCEKHDIIIVKEFVDDGYSGGNFERPGFQAMLNHLSGGKVNMVITKDLSRLGRDMTESSYYAERFFPEMCIRDRPCSSQSRREQRASTRSIYPPCPAHRWA